MDLSLANQCTSLLSSSLSYKIKSFIVETPSKLDSLVTSKARGWHKLEWNTVDVSFVDKRTSLLSNSLSYKIKSFIVETPCKLDSLVTSKAKGWHKLE